MVVAPTWALAVPAAEPALDVPAALWAAPMALEMQAVEQGPEEGVELALAKVAMEAVAAAALEAAVAAIREELLTVLCMS
jgi:hypothetical protein